MDDVPSDDQRRKTRTETHRRASDSTDVAFSAARWIAFLSANHIDPDIAVETFILAPGDQAASALTHPSDAGFKAA